MGYVTLAFIIVDAFVLTVAWRNRFEYGQWREQPLYSKIFLASVAAGAIASTTLTLLAISLYLSRS
ncbi:MAG TPA: hypothetical protein VFG50_06235 [Rhodothermales bacterium]|nr:hypothetical protein [Rhodothermales bacterium]